MQSKKRFTEISIWELSWFSNFNITQKLFCLYLNHRCDNIGIWDPNFKLAAYHLEFKGDPEEFGSNFLKLINKDEERVLVLENGKWFLTGFVKFQYVKNSPLNENNKAHRSYLKQIDESGLRPWFEKNQPEVLSSDNINENSVRPLIDLSKSYKDKDKDKDIDMDKEKEQEKETDKVNDMTSSSSYLTAVTPDDELSDLNETVDDFDLLLKTSDSVERILKKWPNHQETSGFVEFMECENILKTRLRAGSTLYDAEVSINDDLIEIRKNKPEIALDDALHELLNIEEKKYKEAS